jgi:hypothetical protein
MPNRPPQAVYFLSRENKRTFQRFVHATKNVGYGSLADGMMKHISNEFHRSCVGKKLRMMKVDKKGLYACSILNGISDVRRKRGCHLLLATQAYFLFRLVFRYLQ